MPDQQRTRRAAAVALIVLAVVGALFVFSRTEMPAREPRPEAASDPGRALSARVPESGGKEDDGEEVALTDAERGGIEGVVFDDVGPVADAEVHLYPDTREQPGPNPCVNPRKNSSLLDGDCLAAALEAARRLSEGSLHAEALDFVQADENGRFRFAVPPGGRYTVATQLDERSSGPESARAGSRVLLRLEGRFTASGVVLDSAHEPLPTATVTVLTLAPLGVGASVPVDREGRFTVTDLPHRGAVLLARAEGHLPAIERASERPMRIVLAAPTSLRGTVLEDGRPAEGASVTLVTDGLATTTGADGTFTFDQAERHHFKLVARRGEKAATASGSLGSRREVTLSLAPTARLRVNVVVSTPLARPPRLSLRGRSGEKPQPVAVGPLSFEWQGLPADRYSLFVDAQGHAPYDVRLDVGPGAELTHEAVLVAGGRLRGTVVDADGRPVSEARIEFRPPGGGPGGLTLLHGTNDSGAFETTELAPGTWSLTVEAEGHPRWFGSVVVPGEITVRLERSTALRVRATGADGRPIAGAAVTVEPPADPGEDADVVGRARLRRSALGRERAVLTGEDGTAALTVGQGELSVGVTHPEYLPARTSVHVRGNTAAVHEVRLDPGRAIAGRVLDEAGQPVARANVVAVAGRERVTAKADDEGRFVLKPLPPGDVMVHATPPGAKFAVVKPVRLSAGADDVTLTVGQEIRRAEPRSDIH